MLRAGLLPAVVAAATSCVPVRPDTSGAATSVYRPSSESAAAAVAPIAPRPEILAREPWKYTTATGEILRTANYRIYSTAEDPVIRERLAAFIEHALAHYRTAITPLPAPTARLDTYLLNNRPQWERLTKQLMGPQAEMLLKIPRGGYASRGIGVYYNIGLFDTLAIAGHEGWHQFTQRVLAEPLPVWLEEGLATFMEGHRWEENQPVFRAWSNVQRFDQLRKAASNKELLPLSEILESRPQDFLETTDDRVLTFYAQLWALTHFLNEGENGKYRASLKRVIDDAASGRLTSTIAGGESAAGDRPAMLAARTGPAVFLTYFNENLDAAEGEYQRFLDLLTQTGSRGPIVEGRSPITGMLIKSPGG